MSKIDRLIEKEIEESGNFPSTLPQKVRDALEVVLGIPDRIINIDNIGGGSVYVDVDNSSELIWTSRDWKALEDAGLKAMYLGQDKTGLQFEM